MDEQGRHAPIPPTAEYWCGGKWGDKEMPPHPAFMALHALRRKRARGA